MTKESKEVVQAEGTESSLLPSGGSQVDNLIALAIQKDLDMDKLQKLLDMKKEIDREKARKLYYESLSMFQRNLPELKKTKRVFFKIKDGGEMEYWYCPLSEIEKQIKKPLSEAGLSYRWEIKELDGKELQVTCFINHNDGHVESTTMSGPVDDSGRKNAIQQKGSTITYLQRYTLVGALGLSSADTDLDGRGGPKNEPVKGLQANPKLPHPTEAAWENLKKRVKEGKGTAEQALQSLYLNPKQIEELLSLEPNAK